MNEYKYEICIGMDIVAKDVPEQYLMTLVRALLNEYDREDNISILITRGKSYD